MSNASASAGARPRLLALDASPETLWRAGVAALTCLVATFLFARLMVWPPHEDETLALFTGRGSVGELWRTVLGERGGAPLHFLFAWAIAHLGGGLVELRLVSAVFAAASVPLIAVLVRRLTDRTVALLAAAIVVPSWMLLFHGVYARMYSMFLFTATLSYLALPVAIDRGSPRAWALWALAVLLCIATHPYGALVLASQGLYVLYAHRLRESLPAFVVVALLAIPFWRSDTVLAGRFDVGVGGGGTKLGSPLSILEYLEHVAGDFTVGWTGAREAIVAFAFVGLFMLARRRRASAVFAGCVLITPFLFFAVTRIGSGTASPESRNLIFALPVFAMLLAVPLARLTRTLAGVVLVVAAVIALGVGDVAWGLEKTRRFYVGESRVRTDAREAAS